MQGGVLSSSVPPVPHRLLHDLGLVDEPLSCAFLVQKGGQARRAGEMSSILALLISRYGRPSIWRGPAGQLEIWVWSSQKRLRAINGLRSHLQGWVRERPGGEGGGLMDTGLLLPGSRQEDHVRLRRSHYTLLICSNIVHILVGM